MITKARRSSPVPFVLLCITAVVVGLGILGLSYYVFQPVLFGKTVETPPDQQVKLPDYDYKQWGPFGVQDHGRTKPFASACEEAVRNVCGKAKFQGKDPVAVVLSWMMTNGVRPPKTELPEWEEYPFILCEHKDLRTVIYEHVKFETYDENKDGVLSEQEVSPIIDNAQLARLPLENGCLTKAGWDKWYEDLLNGKYISPKDLRTSPGLQRVLDAADKVREKDREKAQQLMNPEERKAEEVMQRLVSFDSISQNNPKSQRRMQQHEDPFHFLTLDRVPDSAWFSFGELRQLKEDKSAEKELWRNTILIRMGETPQRYLSPERQQNLKEFQEQLKAKKGTQAISELTTVLTQRDAERVQDFAKRYKGKDSISVTELQSDPVVRDMGRDAFEQLKKWVNDRVKSPHGGGNDSLPAGELTAELTRIFAANREKVLGEFQSRVAQAVKEGYHPEEQKWRMLHLQFLENRFPDVYRESATWQAYPAADVDRALVVYDSLKKAYISGDADAFNAASQDFFRTVRQLSDRTLIDGLAQRNPTNSALMASHQQVKSAETSGDSGQVDAAADAFFTTARQEGTSFHRYPGDISARLLGVQTVSDTLDLEMRFTRVQPFLWAWVLMFVALVCFGAAYWIDSRGFYIAGFAFYAVSLGFQAFGFFCRVAISGRAPVTNMYETVIFVAAMSSVFALVLEWKYRAKVIALAGALVATIGLVLADQLPLALDPKISPLVPVLRSNFWLTIHVLTIVSSYAGGTLAWGLGNLSLALLAFGQPRKDLVKTLAAFTKRAMEIAVILLAAGTFLGGWWAAYSWGRFWGWDPKEVWALISLVVYVIPLHARYIGWVKDFGLAVSAVLCYSAIVACWYGVNFVLGAGLHSYGFGGGGPWWVFWAALINVEFVVICSIIYSLRSRQNLAPADSAES
ncbi:MAG: cytochrome c biogenesis protein CcsA [Gemmataceae bacterium]|nr:cytochrome c biogenesis protein CcsA [Gemmataceae bacterium]